MERNAAIAFAVSVLLLFAGCSSSELTRERAKDIIEKSDNYKPQKRPVLLAPSEVDICIKQGYLKWEWVFPYSQLSVTEKGKKLFDGAQGQIGPGNVALGLYAVIPSVPIRPRVLEVTGITDGDNGSKVVEYQWSWNTEGQRQEVQDLIFKKSRTYWGKATFKLYDDGWRVAAMVGE